MKKNELIQWSVLFGLIIADQFSKEGALRVLTHHDIEITSFFRFHLTFNQGIAFSIPMPQIFLLLITGIFLAGLIWWFLSVRHTKLESWGAIFLIAGGVGNFIDRFLRGEVVDFLSFWDFPVFNSADVFINVGIALILLSYFQSHNSKKST